MVSRNKVNAFSRGLGPLALRFVIGWGDLAEALLIDFQKMANTLTLEGVLAEVSRAFHG